ncbi:MAG: hypothetical protein M1822_005987 [Bathelium mastoideum]|nr:MAG: hypothetical protein M1822_005987 [Bathelium mastoideum]
MGSFVDIPRQHISPETNILTPQHADFEASLARWSNIDLKTPKLIIKPFNVNDVVTFVKEASKAGVPIVAASGGHSPWSTVEDGIIIDLCNCKQVNVATDKHQVTIVGGVLAKELQLELTQRGRFTTVPNGNTVGMIPYCTGGGISAYSPLIGYACENIVSAKIITANGDLVTASDTDRSELLWAIRGAGQFFGIVIEITLRTYDLSVIGPDGTRQIAVVYFPIDRAVEVCKALAEVVSGPGHPSAGHFMVMKTSERGHVLMVAPQCFGTGPEMQATFKPVIDLGPELFQHMDSTFEKHSDHLAWMCPKGEFKRFSQTGLSSINPENFVRLVELHKRLLDTYPGTERSVFTLEWHTRSFPEARQTPTSFGLKDIDVWLNVLSWYTDPALHDTLLSFDREAQEIMRSNTVPEAYIAYTNTSRNDPIEYRYKGDDTVKKLRALKREWDPKGVFTTELL